MSDRQGLVDLGEIEHLCGDDDWGAKITAALAELRELRALRASLESYVAEMRERDRWHGRRLNDDVKEHVESLEALLRKGLNQEDESLIARLRSMSGAPHSGPDVLFGALPELIGYLEAEDSESGDALLARKAFAAKLGVKNR